MGEPHSPDDLKLLSSFNAFLDGLSLYFSEPVRLTEEEVREHIRRLEQRPLPRNDYYIVASTLSIDLPYHVNVIEKLPVQREFFNADIYLQLVHPHYFRQYLEWAWAGYRYIDKKSKRGELEPFNVYFCISFPIKMRNGKYHWTRMEVCPLQVDKDHNMITHLNRYTVLEPYDEKPEKPLIGEIWDENFLNENWTKELGREKFFHLSVFVLTPVQRQIVDIFYQNPGYTNRDVAAALNKKLNTIERHNKDILAEAKESFPNFDDLKIKTVKKFARFLHDYNYFDGVQQPPDTFR